MNKLSIFLSHSHKDIEKIRKIRDILEMINCDPIMFYLKCLDDSNEQLEEFILQEINARNIFLYCKSHNSESSAWVQKEIEYIQSIDSRRMYTLDIENDFEHNIVSILSELSKVFKKNTVILYHAKADNNIATAIGEKLQLLGYAIQYLNPEIHGSPLSMKQISSCEYTMLHDQYSFYFEKEIIPNYKKLCQNGLLIPIISRNMFDGDWSAYVSSKALRWFESNINLDIVPVTVDYSEISNESIVWDCTDACLEKIIAAVQVKSGA